jgi:hypothetical protein
LGPTPSGQATPAPPVAAGSWRAPSQYARFRAGLCSRREYLQQWWHGAKEQAGGSPWAARPTV